MDGRDYISKHRRNAKILLGKCVKIDAKLMKKDHVLFKKANSILWGLITGVGKIKYEDEPSVDILWTCDNGGFSETVWITSIYGGYIYLVDEI